MTHYALSPAASPRQAIRSLLAIAALATAAMPALAQTVPPTSGTMSIETKTAGADLDTSAPVFTDAVGKALAAHGFTLLDDAGHAGFVAMLSVSRTDVGTTSAKVAKDHVSAGPGGATGVGASLSVPLPSAKTRSVPLLQTRVEVSIARRGETVPVWKGAVTTVRGAGTREGQDGRVAADLAEAVLRAYPAQSDEAISVP